MFSNRRVLVTGGAGFIGSHLCEGLLARGDEVLCVDNFFTATRPNVSGLMLNSRFELVRHDVCFPLYVEVDKIYNLACPASPIHYQFDPVQTTKTSVHGAINMLGLAKRIKVALIFNTYGPRMHPNDGRVVSNFIVQALRNNDITVYGDGVQTRSFCYVDDLVEGLIRLMETDDGVVGPVNLGNPEEFTIRQLAEIVIDITGSASKIVHRPLPTDDPKQRQPEISKAQELLGWRPTVPLRVGLTKTAAYFEEQLAREVATAVAV